MPNNPAVGTIRSVHVYTTNMTRICTSDTIHIPCICTHLDISSLKLMVFHVECQVLEAHSALQHSCLQSTQPISGEETATVDSCYGTHYCNTYSTGGCCLAGSAACPDTLICCCFRSIMSRPGAESCP